jgi:hypothetical protein
LRVLSFTSRAKPGALEHGGAGHLVLQLFQFCFSILARPDALLFYSIPLLTSGQEPKAAKSKAGKGAARNPE